jgi:hypothetical protein
MEIIINDTRRIFAIQKEFTKMFPFLKLEFSAKPYKSSGASPEKKTSVSPSKTIGECRTVHTTGILTITPHMTISDLDEILNDNLGLSVKIFQKSGSTWVELTTNMIPLEKLNMPIQETNLN